MHIRLIACFIALALIATAHAFEPGSDRVCTPSADGQSFECRDKSGNITAPSTAKPVKAEPSMPTPATSAPITGVVTQSAAPAASEVPNYLLQNSAQVQPAPRVEPAAVAEIATSESAVENPVANAQPAPAEPAKVVLEPLPAAPAVAARPQTSKPTVQPAPSIETSTETAQATSVMVEKPTTTPATTVQPAATAAAQSPVVDSPDPNPAARIASVAHSRNIAEASAFLDLPASHYTLVLASVRNTAALDALILALDPLPGQLYLLKLRMPDGDWYSLCWSEFDDLDGARAARASLPADAAITSGWPRKIGLLQKELAR